MAKRTKKIVCFSICTILLCMNFMSVKAEALPDVMSGTTTLADNIMTYYALSGSAVANTDWINTLYNSYGSSFGTIEELADQGYLVLNDAGFWEPVEQLGEMIEQAPAYSSLGLNEMFNVSAEEAAAGGGFAAASGGSILAGSLGGVASTGVVPLLGGVTAAYWGGIALGTLIAHGLGLYGESVSSGTPITFREALDSLPAGNASGAFYYPNGARGIYYTSGSQLVFVIHSNNSKIAVLAKASNAVDGYQYGYRKRLDYNDSGDRWSFKIENGYGYYDNVDYSSIGTYLPVVNIGSESISNYVGGLRRGEIDFPTIKSPDLIGENGNLQAEDDNGNITVPDMKPQIDPGTQAGKPLTLQDWLNFANSVSNNNNNVNPTPDGNQGLFDQILDLIKTAIPENNPNPNPNPNPGGDPYSPPVVTPVPDPSYPDPVPDQPTSENPDESENPQETEPLDPVDTGKPWMLPDLTKKFPFCIPWDIKDCFTLLKSNIRQAPHITWRFNPPNTPIDYTFNLDLSDFEPVAILLRTLELIAFIAGLAFATRYLIGAS